MHSRPLGLLLGIFLGSLLGLLLGLGAAGPRPARAAAAPVGQALSDVVLNDLDDRPVALRDLAGRAVALLLEDRDTKEGENQALKDALGVCTERHGARFRLFAVADVSPYDFWPARRYAKDALRKVAGQGVQLLADWKGALRRRLGLRGSQSTLILLGPDGRVALLLRGPQGPREIEAVTARVAELARAARP